MQKCSFSALSVTVAVIFTPILTSFHLTQPILKMAQEKKVGSVKLSQTIHNVFIYNYSYWKSQPTIIKDHIYY